MVIDYALTFAGVILLAVILRFSSKMNPRPMTARDAATVGLSSVGEL